MELGVPSEAIREATRAMFDEVADNPSGQYRFAVGRALAEAVGYPSEVLATLPESASAAFTGLHYLHPILAARPGEWILDLGCGAGLDSVLIARAVAPGSVFGVDLSRRMAEKARELAIHAGVERYTTFEAADAASLPFNAHTFDAALVNGFFNLCPDKASVAKQLHRVLRGDGRAIVAEITYVTAPPASPLRTVSDWFR